MSFLYGIQPEMNHLHGVCDPHMNGLSLQVKEESCHTEIFNPPLYNVFPYFADLTKINKVKTNCVAVFLVLVVGGGVSYIKTECYKRTWA